MEKLASRPLHTEEHHIVTDPKGQPPCGKPRRLFGYKLAAARNEIQTMLRLGIIRKSRSSWVSPLHVALKPDGTYRPCGDFR